VESYAPSQSQPKFDRAPEELNEHEQIIRSFLQNQDYVDKLIEYWSLEEKKGNDELPLTYIQKTWPNK